MERCNDPRRALELRCPMQECRCSARGKLLAMLINLPREATGSGAVLQLACPYKKSRLIRIRL